MLFGLINAPTTMQCLINNVFREYLNRFCIMYLDDILIFLNNKKEHEEHILMVFKILQKANLRIKLEKCEFHI